MYIRDGVTRKVFIFSKVAIKIPTFRSWELFLSGILANLQEKKFSGTHPMLLPVLFSFAGLINIMPACEKTFATEEDEQIIDATLEQYKDDNLFEFLQSDCHPANFGIYENKIVKVDYGNY
jgi:hypothetical protein